MTENELLHYGVLGMKWGVKKARKSSDTVDETRRKSNTQNSNTQNSNTQKFNTQKSNTQNSNTKQQSKKFVTKKQKQKQIMEDLNSMSDKELRERLNRMQMEQQYIRMMTPEKSAAKKQVEQFLINEGRNLASQMLREQIRKQTNKK